MISFSIITVTFNAEECIQPTLKSIEQQTYPLVEHIIIDNCSTDNTLLLCNEYLQATEENDNEHVVKIMSEPDKGLYDAMNKGLRQATNDYIVFLNAGDRLPANDTLETIAACVGEGESLPAVLYGDTNIVNKDGYVIGKRAKRPPVKLTWKKFMWGMLVCHQAFYARTDIAKTTPYDLKYKFSSDVDWCIRIMKQAEKQHLPIRNTNTIIADFLEGGTTTANHKASLRERFKLMKHHYGLLTTLFTHAIFCLKTAKQYASKLKK